MLRQHFLVESVLFDHDLKVNVDVFSTSQVVGFFLLLLTLQILHLYPPLFSLLLDSLYFVQRIRLFLLSSLHVGYMKIKLKTSLRKG